MSAPRRVQSTKRRPHVDVQGSPPRMRGRRVRTRALHLNPRSAKSVSRGSVAPTRKAYYNSRDGFMTMVWGPMMWFILHTVSFNYPCKPTPEQKRHYQQYYESIQNILPCGACRKNLKNNIPMSGYGPHVYKNRATLSRWVYRLHCTVNRMLNKPSPPYDTVRTMYERFRARCNDVGSTNRNRRSPHHHRHLPMASAHAIHGHATESGCTEALSGVRSKCILNIVPCDECSVDEQKNSINVHPRCCRAYDDVYGTTKSPSNNNPSNNKCAGGPGGGPRRHSLGTGWL